MSDALLYGILAAVGLLILILVSAVKIVREYERGVIFRLGRVIGAKGPGLFVIIPVVDRMVRVNAVSYFNVVDPVKATVAIQDYMLGTSQVAQTTLRSILGQVDLDDLLVNRDEINQRLQKIIDDLTNPWGVKVTLVEVKDVELPETMRRAMAAQAEAERERRAKVIHAQGEFEAAGKLSQAGEVLERRPGAMTLRMLSTMTEVATDKNSTLIFPIPIELLRFAAAAAPTPVPDGDGEQPGTAST
jgi:regulator of protease activity HflC (stomatin/prohibitin superfamily)